MNGLTVPAPRKLGVRLLLLAAAFQLAASLLLLFVAVLQGVLMLATDSANARLKFFGRSLGRYLAQIADFESFASESLPFPFSEWPVADDLSGV
ncbi:MAG: DUF4389 domain-containing protein [Polaromonas sp.]|jgi:hypothetical protein|uniref:DUF4389 domain-containing protein n=1 Tax=Polaromonas sp. TaxID=1869339 RepID=UPI0027316B48|nr:DUF4389 domain-containing protein [Polaromonas sp.]MDP2254945.1 DUF4389 domain-containing protein [Polaromonas sp.]